MAFDLAKMFSGNKDAQPAPQASQQPQGEQQQQQKPNESAFQSSDAGDPKETDARTEESQESPMDEFADLFTMETNEGDESEQGSDPDSFFSYDPDKLREKVNNLNFAQMEGASELADNALKGDPKALMQLVNGVAQQTFYQAAEFSSNVANRTAKESYTRSSETLPSSVRSLMAKDEMEGLKPEFKHKALQPIVQTVQGQLEQKYPDASPREISGMVNKYMSSVAKTFGGAGDDSSQGSSQDSSRSVNNGQPDFSNFFPGLDQL